jgi:hypothetical protein
MSTTQNILYSAVQSVHNLGAVAVAGGTLSGAVLKSPAARKTLAWIALAGWGTQAVSGATFGAVSWYFYHKFPDIGETATTALYIKMACAASGFMLLAAYLYWGAKWKEAAINRVWLISALLAFTALFSAAVLRWFS